MAILGLIRLLLIGLCIWLIYRGVRSFFAGRAAQRDRLEKERQNRRPPAQVVEALVQDPQCQTYLPKGDAVRAVVDGKELFFCSEQCRDAYLAQRGKTT